MNSQYEKIIGENLRNIFKPFPSDLEHLIPASRKGDSFLFKAFGEDCCLGPQQIILSGKRETGPKGVLIALYVRHAKPDPLTLEPFTAFRDLPGSMPYQGAFTINSERILIPHAEEISRNRDRVLKAFNGHTVCDYPAGDFSLLLYPLPKIALNYVFYLADEEFSASVTCLFSANAPFFMPMDGLADIAEYTSKKLLEIIKNL
ncbi:MAG: DUF3786 domain-containing protein [Deltaproteobacteria bacterium]|nr:DUF3786 domain-containing protein [Deltaproteobacteria bacterium]